MNTVVWFSPSYCIFDIPSWMKRLLLQHPTSKRWLESLFESPVVRFYQRPVDGETWWSKFHFDLECSKSEDPHLGGEIYPICIPQSMWVKTYNHRMSHNDIPITCTCIPYPPNKSNRISQWDFYLSIWYFRGPTSIFNQHIYEVLVHIISYKHIPSGCDLPSDNSMLIGHELGDYTTWLWNRELW